MTRNAVILLSGGLDSADVLAYEVWHGRRVQPLFFNYGQPQLAQELEAVQRLCNYFRLERLGAFTLPPFYHREYDYTMRNLVMLGMAVNSADALYDQQKPKVPVRVLTGIRQSDYADTSELFVNVFGALTASLAQDRVVVEHPIFHLDKRQVIIKARRRSFPFHLTFSCIATTTDKVCGECATCLEFIKYRHLIPAGECKKSIPYSDSKCVRSLGHADGCMPPQLSPSARRPLRPI